jgi:hypothetical protein
MQITTQYVITVGILNHTTFRQTRSNRSELETATQTHATVKSTFSDAFENCVKRKAASCVCPSTWNNSAPNGRIFMKFYMYVSIFRKSIEKNHVSLKSNKKSGYFTWRLIYIFITSRWHLHRMRTVSEQRCNRKSEHTIYVQFFFSENRAVYKIMRNNTVETDR